MASSSTLHDGPPEHRAAATTAPATPGRMALIDALRGVAIVVVVLSHGWILWPIEWIDDHDWVRPVFRSGNFAVTIFLVVTGYLTYRSLSAHGLPNMRIGVSLVRRVLRVAPVTLVVVPVVIVASAFTDDATSSRANWETFLHISTYTWNWHLQTDAVTSRWDLGHMWYLSVDMQAFVAMSIVLYFVRRRPWGQVAALTGILVLLTWWRMHVTELEPVLNVLLRTTARMDAFVAGLLLGAVLALLGPRHMPRHVGILATAALLPLLWLCSDDERFLHWGVTLLELDLAVLLAAIVLGPQRAVPSVLRPATFLGRHSLSLYVWHYPAFAAVEARTSDWAWAPRALVALLVTAALCVATHYLIERHVARLLVHPFWGRLRPREDAAQDADPRDGDLRVDDLSLPTGRT